MCGLILCGICLLVVGLTNVWLVLSFGLLSFVLVHDLDSWVPKFKVSCDIYFSCLVIVA